MKILGLEEIAGAFAEALRPLAPLGAQLVWIAQPALSVFVDPERVAGWAHQLEGLPPERPDDA